MSGSIIVAGSPAQSYEKKNVMRRDGANSEVLGSDRASSEGYIVRWVEAPSNKLLTTVFEASLESVAVTLQAKRRQQDNRDSY